MNLKSEASASLFCFQMAKLLLKKPTCLGSDFGSAFNYYRFDRQKPPVFKVRLNIMNQNVFYPNQPAAKPPELHFCFKCRWEGRISQTVCPRCGKRLFSQKNVRGRGVLLTFLGLFLSGFMSAIAFFVTAMLIQASKNPKTEVKFNGDEHMFIMIYLIFAGVIAMGVTMILAGIWQIIFGRRNMILIWIFFALIFLTFFVGGIFRAFAD